MPLGDGPSIPDEQVQSLLSSMDDVLAVLQGIGSKPDGYLRDEWERNIAHARIYLARNEIREAAGEMIVGWDDILAQSNAKEHSWFS